MAYKRIIKAAVYVLTSTLFALQANSVLAQTPPLQRPIVVELFTSQGCSSCPPADKLLEELIMDGSLLPLSFHVDYWNKFGWEDPFSNPHFSRRQSVYNANLNTPGTYTPQIVVDGVFETIGSYKHVVYNLINEAKVNANQITLSLEPEDNGLRVSIPESPLTSSASVWLIGYDNQRTSYIGGGENRGKQLSTFNVVRYLEHIGTYEGKPLILHVQFHWKEPTDNVVVILQENAVGRILGVGQ